MHDIEPHYSWRHIYTAENDPISPFYGREYNEFAFLKLVTIPNDIKNFSCASKSGT